MKAFEVHDTYHSLIRFVKDTGSARGEVDSFGVIRTGLQIRAHMRTPSILTCTDSTVKLEFNLQIQGH